MAKKKPRPRPRPKPTDPLPLVLYAIAAQTDGWCIGHQTFNRFENGERVGVYDLREVRTLQVTKGLR